MRDPPTTAKYTRLFDEVIRKAGSKTVIFVTWAPLHAAYSQKDVTARYLEIARSLRARVAPVGVAMGELRQAGLEMYDSVSHPTLLGTYLSACVFYSMFYGESPAGAKYRFDVKYDIPEFYRRDLEQETIPAHVAETIQRKAWETVSR
jgi:hypothetical protein